MASWFRKNEFPVEGRTVLITGGSQGMGLAVAQQLAAKGANIIIVARTESRLISALEQIRSSASSPSRQTFHHISADLTSAAESTRIIQTATSLNGNSPPDIVFCCAGSSYPTLFIDTPTEQLDAMMSSNYFTAAYMAQAVLRAWLSAPAKPSSTAQPARHLVFTASFLSFFTIAGYASYSPSKAALRSLADTLSNELLLYALTHVPVRVHTVFPATIFTESYEAENKVKSDLTKKLEEDDAGQTAEEVARRSIQGLERGEEMVTTTWLTRMVMCGVLGGSRRNGWGMLDTLLAWLMSWVMVIVRRDIDGKVRKWGRENGVSGARRGKD